MQASYAQSQIETSVGKYCKLYQCLKTCNVGKCMDFCRSTCPNIVQENLEHLSKFQIDYFWTSKNLDSDLQHYSALSPTTVTGLVLPATLSTVSSGVATDF